MVGQRAKSSVSDSNINKLCCIWEASHTQSVTHMMTVHSYALYSPELFSAIHDKVRTEILHLRRVQLYRNAILNTPFGQSTRITYRNSPIK